MAATTSPRFIIVGRLVSVLVLVCSGVLLTIGAADHRLPIVLLGCGMLLGGIFGLRHNLLDVSDRALDPDLIGRPWLALLATAGLLILASLMLSIFT